MEDPNINIRNLTPFDFPNRDPIEEDGGLNQFALTGNDPLSQWDFIGQ
jgi:hypothetical protein